MFFYYYPMNMTDLYYMGNTMSRLLMDMKKQAELSAQSPAADDVFYAVLGEKTSGPYSLAEIRELIRNGEIKSETYIWKPGMSGWRFARETEGVAHLVGITPPPAPAKKDSEQEKREEKE